MDRLELARELIAGGDYSGALREYEKAERPPGDERALCGKALVYIITGMSNKAAECMRAALKQHAGASYPHGILGVIAEDVSGQEDAMNCYDSMLRADPSEASPYVRKAQIFLYNGLEKECADIIRECAKNADLGAETPMAIERLRILFEDVLAGQTPAIKINDSAVFVPGLRGLLDRAVGDELPSSPDIDVDAASLGTRAERIHTIEVLEQHLKTQSSGTARCAMGELLQSVGRTDEAMACYERAIREEPNNMLGYGLKLGVLQEAGDRAGIARCIDEALKAAPKDKSGVLVQKNLRSLRDLCVGGKTKFTLMDSASVAQRHVARRRKR